VFSFPDTAGQCWLIRSLLATIPSILPTPPTSTHQTSPVNDSESLPPTSQKTTDARQLALANSPNSSDFPSLDFSMEMSLDMSVFDNDMFNTFFGAQQPDFAPGSEFVDFDAFAIDETLDSRGVSASPKGAQPPSPASTESQQSQFLDFEEHEQNLFSGSSPAGIMHAPEDLQAQSVFGVATADANDLAFQQALADLLGTSAVTAAPTTLPNPFGNIATDPTIASFVATVNAGAVSEKAAFGNAFSQDFDWDNLIPQVAQGQQVASNPLETASPAAGLGWASPTAPTLEAISPADLVISPRAGAKRKNSDSSDDSAPLEKKPRGRPKKVDSDAELAAKRTKKLKGSPLARSVTVAEDDDSASSPATSVTKGTKKPASAAPKSTIPQKHLARAESITGMTAKDIKSFATWEDVIAHLKTTAPERVVDAVALGEQVERERQDAAWAAKKARDDKANKIVTLEGRIETLVSASDNQRQFLLALVATGRLSQAELAAYDTLAAPASPGAESL